MVIESITFDGTKNSQLIMQELPEAVDPISDMGALLRQTTAYRSYYDGEVVRKNTCKEYYDGTCQETITHPRVVLIRGSPVESNTTRPTNSGIVGTVLTAYNLHQNLQFRPDDLWISILAQFSAYVNGRAEELRPKIVSHDGQKPLEVIGQGNIYTADFGFMTRQFLDKISENIRDESLLEWFLPNFTTSTVTDQVCASAMAMCGFQAYFTYKYVLICGIPEIKLLGSADDWMTLRDKVDRVLEFDGADKILSTEWVPRLRIILDNFVASAQGSPNIDFWDGIVSHTGHGCAGPDFLTGWITTFSMFDQHGQLYSRVDPDHWPILGIDDIYHNVASCPVTINDNGKPWNATLFVGQMAYDYETLNTTSGNALPPSLDRIRNAGKVRRIVKPRNDWALAIEEGFVELQPKDSSDPPDAAVVSMLGGGECSVDDAWQIAAAPILNSTAVASTATPDDVHIPPDQGGQIMNPPTNSPKLFTEQSIHESKGFQLSHGVRQSQILVFFFCWLAFSVGYDRRRVKERR